MTENKMICYCRKIDTTMIKNAVQEGASTLKDVMEITGAGTACGMCVLTIENVINEELSK